MTDPQHIKEIFGDAAELASPERAAFLDQACAGDAAARAEVEGLLAAAEGTDALLGRTAAPPRPGGTSEDPPVGGDAADSAAERPGSFVGRYKLLQRIGEGGFGTVYMAEQEHPVRRRVALKVIKLGMDTRQVVARFEAERQALALMDHPNIARVLDAGATESGRPYFVMELVRGVPLTDYCDTNNLPTRQRLELFVQVCRAVQHAHTKGVIHRDLKPGNVLVTLHDGVPVPKVIDFGIAKATESRLTERTLFTEFHQMVGTPAYMSPEQAEMSGLDVDTRSDVYSLGVLLYELLTGTTPFDARDLREKGYGEIQRIIREVEPPRPSTRLSTLGDAVRTAVAARHATDAARLGRLVRGELDWIVMRALEKDRTRRYETANGMGLDVQRYLNDEAVQARPSTAAYRVRKFARRHRAGVAVATAASCAVLVGLAVATVGMVSALRARAEEARHRREAEKAKQTVEAANDFLHTLLMAAGARVPEAPGRVGTAARQLEEGWLADQPQALAACRLTLGWYFMQESNIAEAERQFEAGLAAVRAADGTVPPEFAAPARWGLMSAAGRRGDHASADRHGRDAAKAYRAMAGTERQLADVLWGLSAAKAELGDTAGADALRLESTAVRAEALIPEDAARPWDGSGYFNRGVHRLRHGRTAEAITDFAAARALDPAEHWIYVYLACAQLYAGDVPGYRVTSQEMFRRFGHDLRPEVRERTAKACLLVADPAAEPAALAKLIDDVIAGGEHPEWAEYFYMSKGLADYRAGRYASALDALERARQVPSHACWGTVLFLKAMTLHRTGSVPEAAAAFEEGNAVAQTVLPDPAPADLGNDLDNKIVCEIMRREATAMIGGGRSATSRPATQPTAGDASDTGNATRTN